MKTLITSLLLLASTQTFAAETCFWADRIWDFRVVNDQTVVVSEPGNKEYKVEVSFCHNLNWAQKIAFQGFSTNYICRSDKMLVFEDYFSKRPDQICRITRITALK